MEDKEKLEQTEQKVFLNEQELKDVSGGDCHITPDGYPFRFGNNEDGDRWCHYIDLLNEVDCPSCGHRGLRIRRATPGIAEGICPKCGKYSYFNVSGETLTLMQ